MIVDKIDVLGDPRVEQRSAYVNGKQYGKSSRGHHAGRPTKENYRSKGEPSSCRELAVITNPY